MSLLSIELDGSALKFSFRVIDTLSLEINSTNDINYYFEIKFVIESGRVIESFTRNTTNGLKHIAAALKFDIIKV